MALVSFGGASPLESLLQLQAGLDRLLERPSLGLDLGTSGRDVFPPVNLFLDRDGGLLVRAEMPGVAADGVQVTIEPRRLSIAGERVPPAAGGGGFHRRERAFGRFARTIRLPEDLDASAATAEVRQGLLTVRIPKRSEARARQIAITRA